MDPEVKEESLRDTLSSAFDEVATKVEDTPTEETGTDPLAPETTGDQPAPEPKDTPIVEEKKDTPIVEGKREAKPKGVEELTEAPQGKSRAPGSWTPSAREKWTAVPQEVQKEILRRERDIATGYNNITNIKRDHDTISQIFSRHQAIIGAEGGDAIKLTNDLYGTAAALYHGAPQIKAETIANLIKTFGVDIAALDGVLSARAADPNAAPARHAAPQQDAQAYIEAAVQRALQPILGARTEAVHNDVSTELETFATDPKNEFFEDLRHDMADIIDMSTKRGQKITLQDAYTRASMMHSEISGIVAERRLKGAATAASAVAAQARKKAVSVTGAPSDTLASAASAGNIRDDLSAAFDALS